MSLPPPSDPAAAAAQAAFYKFSIEAWSLLGVAFLVTIIRTYVRVNTLGFKSLQLDDYLVWVGVIFYAIETALAYSVGSIANGLANNGMTDKQRAALSPDSAEYRLRVLGSKIQLCGWSTYGTLLWSLKSSLLVLYSRLTFGLKRSYRIRIYIGFCFIIASWMIVLMNLFLACRPFHKYWQIYPDPGNVCQPAISNQIIWVFLGFNVATDLYLLYIPIPMLWQSSIKPLKKIGLMLLFSGGLLVVGCAILRVVMIVMDPINGAQSAGSWAVRETFIAVIMTNMPMIFPPMKRWTTSTFGSLITLTRSSRKENDGTPRELGTFSSGDYNSGHKRDRGPPTANPIPNKTFTESEERMIDEYKMQNIKNKDNGISCSNIELPPHAIISNNIQKSVEFTVVSEQNTPNDQRPVPGDGDSTRPHADFAFSTVPTAKNSPASDIAALQGYG
ncbi:uncharacterized protein PADG_07482 [Paracoccidioides brasiliensis Pb18]|uniref:Rhodopsin domain-containing protein n=1 Tax=Paracoccidioides brasiliensis (strain Pb18) TaxID=502780 RepID=C1GJP6_PARBD|nr:uncharacterized protein PADG_07482 [Paracoccidioides brasiliensis Pb18]EEH42662.2 hypothetical protein PADG_07482 [Paracoccidioides brasiliensis Pb18]